MNELTNYEAIEMPTTLDPNIVILEFLSSNGQLELYNQTRIESTYARRHIYYCIEIVLF